MTDYFNDVLDDCYAMKRGFEVVDKNDYTKLLGFMCVFPWSVIPEYIEPEAWDTIEEMEMSRFQKYIDQMDD